MTKVKQAKTEDKLEKYEERLNALELVVNQLSNSIQDIRMIASGHSSFHLSAESVITCPVTVKMSGFSGYTNDGFDWYSEPFYSSNKGYKLCLVVCPAECDDQDESTHLAVYTSAS